jgi:PAS domain S-box-containing protein
MDTNLNEDKNADSALGLVASDQSCVHTRPVVLFVKAMVVIFVCEAAIMVLLEKVVNVGKLGEIIIDPVLLAIVSGAMLYWIVNPINEMLKTSEKAERKLDLFRNLIDKSNDSIFIIEPETAKILDVNYKACVTLGYGRPDLLNMTILDIGGQITDNHAWAEYVGKVRNYGYMLAERYKRKDGSTFPVEVSASIVKLGQREYIVAVARDTIEREHAQIQLEESETIRKIAECAKDAIIMMGPKGEISFWNPAAERIFGYSRNEAIGKHLHSLLAPGRFHDAYQKGLSCFQKTGQGDALGKTLKLEAIRKNGEEFGMELSVNSVRLGGKWHAVGIIRDMSESKGAEADWTDKDKVAVVTGKSIT